MTATAQLNSALTIAKQYFEDLLRLRTLDQLKALDFGEGAKEKQVKLLLEQLRESMVDIEQGLSRHLKEFDGSPVIEGGPELLRFYREQLRPHARTIQDASLHAVGLWDLL